MAFQPSFLRTARRLVHVEPKHRYGSCQWRSWGLEKTETEALAWPGTDPWKGFAACGNGLFAWLIVETLWFTGWREWRIVPWLTAHNKVNGGHDSSSSCNTCPIHHGPISRKSRNLFGRFSSDTNLFVSSKRRRLEPRNFAVSLIFYSLYNFTEKAVWSFMNGFSSPKSFPNFWETVPMSQWIPLSGAHQMSSCHSIG